MSHMSQIDARVFVWRKTTYSGGGENCIEVASVTAPALNGDVAVQA